MCTTSQLGCLLNQEEYKGLMSVSRTRGQKQNDPDSPKYTGNFIVTFYSYEKQLHSIDGLHLLSWYVSTTVFAVNCTGLGLCMSICRPCNRCGRHFEVGETVTHKHLSFKRILHGFLRIRTKKRCTVTNFIDREHLKSTQHDRRKEQRIAFFSGKVP